MPLARTSIAIDQRVLDRFHALYPKSERSRAIQHLIEKELRERDERLERIADEFETHADFEELRTETKLFDATVADGLGHEQPDGD